jgi:hypothetical protein
VAGLRDELDAEEVRQALNNALRDLAKAKAKTEDLVAATYSAARDAMVAEFANKATARPKKDHRKDQAEVALWHLTDWQGAKLTTSYNREVMRSRVHQFVDHALRITEIQRGIHPVRDCVILFGGDMVEGLFNFPQQVFQVDATLFGQWTSVSRLITEVVQRALAAYDGVTVVSEWGNHGRLGPQRAVIPREDNLDRMCYETARMFLENEDRLTWRDSPEDIQHVEVGSYRALLMHGDETGRHGYVSPTTFRNYVHSLKAGGYGWAFRDVYSGHYHTHTEAALSDGGAWFQTGSTESDNRYARDSLGSAAPPSQRLHFVDPDKGRVTSQWKIWLD